MTRTGLLSESSPAKAIWTRVARLVSWTSSIVRLLRSTGDGWPLALVVLLVAGGLAPWATVYVTRNVVDYLLGAAATRGEWSAVRPLLVWAGLAAGAIVTSQALQAALGWVRTVYADRLQDHITGRILEQSARLDLAFYESADFFDHLHRARA